MRVRNGLGHLSDENICKLGELADGCLERVRNP